MLKFMVPFVIGYYLFFFIIFFKTTIFVSPVEFPNTLHRSRPIILHPCMTVQPFNFPAYIAIMIIAITFTH